MAGLRFNFQVLSGGNRISQIVPFIISPFLRNRETLSDNNFSYFCASNFSCMAVVGKKQKTSGSKPNYFFSIISVSLVLFLLGLFGLIILQGKQLIRTSKEKIEIITEMENAAGEEGIQDVKTWLENRAFIKPGSVKYISKEKGAAMMREEFGEDFLKLDLPNPLYDVLTFNVRAKFMQPDSLARIKAALKEYPFVNDVFYQESLIDVIAKNLQEISFIALGIGVFFLLVAATLIHNTIRLALYSNRFLIKNMELVGASWEFISRPYILRSLKHGFLSAILAIGILAALLFLAQRDLPELKDMLFIPGIAVLFAVLLILGLIICGFSTYFVVNKYLKMRVDELY